MTFLQILHGQSLLPDKEGPISRKFPELLYNPKFGLLLLLLPSARSGKFLPRGALPCTINVIREIFFAQLRRSQATFRREKEARTILCVFISAHPRRRPDPPTFSWPPVREKKKKKILIHRHNFGKAHTDTHTERATPSESVLGRAPYTR